MFGTLIFSLFPLHIYACSQISSAILQSFLIVLFFYLFFKITKKDNFFNICFFSLTSGLLILLRGEFIAFFLLSILYILLFLKMNLKNISWIPSHPVAGTEKSGPRAGSSDLFKDRWTILTPDSKIKDSDVKKLSLFWESMGSKVKIMSAEDHDRILSLTSHLPHVIAYNIVKTAMGDDEKMKKDVIRYYFKDELCGFCQPWQYNLFCLIG